MNRWTNPLMGWTSSADPLENVARAALAFPTKEAAVQFCTRHGWQFAVEDPNPRRVARTKRYADYGANYSVKRKGIPDHSGFQSNWNGVKPSWPLK
jgi:NADH dehydrogenase (ubiquinone) Fe-S protein 4